MLSVSKDGVITFENDKKRKLDEIDDATGTMSGESTPPPSKKSKPTESSDDSSNQKSSSGGDSMDISSGGKRQRADRRPKSGIFVEFNGFPEEEIDNIVSQVFGKENQQDLPGSSARKVPNDLIRVYPSPEEVKRERKAYRKKYNSLPENVTKRKEKSKRPEEIEKRKKNNEDELTKQRKKECAYGRRKVLQEFKEKYPKEYEAMFSKNVAPLPKRERKPREKKLRLVQV